ncbi:GNAT family N-acetyltransferase [Frankia sp. KB5]|uniref:GNAT family N-acetyltransferase n=1 Tax=Frankia sp. KB5 TaxID=683318 RepID=UPI000A121C16|nr:GNAT family N-acetyltransferase [Frankia sp. KB5]ORT46919.1 hypothetical protein KBI5_22565 [Frankia sp. KB5]
MARPRLSAPTIGVHSSFLEAVEEYRAEGGYPDFEDLEIHEPAAFAAYVAALRRDHDLWPSSVTPDLLLIFWWIDGPEYLGRLSVRPIPTPELAEYGHIGYDIKPSARRCGHGTAMLRAALPIVNRLGVDPALLTSRTRNIASRRMIEANGGRFIHQRGDRLYFHLPTHAGSR